MEESDTTKDIEIPGRNTFKIQEYVRNKKLIDFVKGYFKNRISRKGAVQLLRLLFERKDIIFVKDIQDNTRGLEQYNTGKLETVDNKIALRQNEQDFLFQKINDLLLEIGKELPIYDEDKHHGLERESSNGSDVFIVNQYTSYEQVRKVICDNMGDASFSYNFEKPDLEITPPKNMDTLQRCLIQVLGNKVQFDFPIEYVYGCSQCNTRSTKKAYDVVSTNTRYKCEGSDLSGEKPKQCKNMLTPDNEISTTKDSQFFFLSYENSKGEKKTAGAFSFKDFKPGFYEVVLFRIKQPMKQEMYQVVDFKAIESNDIVIPEISKEENYLFTLQKSFDTFIHQQTGMRVFGLNPIKVAMIIQTAFSHLFPDFLKGNIKIVGDASTGKSTIFKYYGFFLNNHLHMSTNGLSISIPALRGTMQKIVLLGKEQSIITTGFLGIYRVIHIDEAGENRELVVNMKTFLLEDNYGYQKAGGDETFHKRTSQMNISQNVDENHLGLYNGKIRKLYKDIDFTLDNVEKVDWDEKWDLHLPLYKYTNPYLRKCVRDVRDMYRKEQKFWIDGYDIALHQRFPFSFYYVIEKENPELDKILKENVSEGTISENLELIRALNSENLEKFFLSLKEFADKIPKANDYKDFEKVDQILYAYGEPLNARIKTFYYRLLKISKIFNKRNVATEQDYDVVRFFIEQTNCKIDVSDTHNYEIKGSPDIEQHQKEMDKIDDTVRDIEGQFGLGEDEF